VCGLLAFTAACSSSPSHPHGSAPSHSASASSSPAAAPGPAAAQLTQAQAKQAFGAFLLRYNAMVKAHQATLVPQLTLDAEEQVRAFGTRNTTGLPAAAQVTERFYVPRLATYPRWFVEVGGTGAGGTSGGDLFVMVQSAPGGPWREADALTFGTPPAQLAGIELDSAGYAAAVAPGDTSLVTPPGQLPGRYVQLLGGTSGTGGAGGTGLFAAGDATTGWIANEQKVRSGAPSDGWNVSFGYAALAFPVYALRTTGGGAVVFFAFDQDSAWTATSSSPRFSASVSSIDGRMPVVVAVEAGLSSIHLTPGTKISSTWLYESVAADPARGQGEVSLLPSEFNGGGVTRAIKS
jgi:hypothetical protein